MVTIKANVKKQTMQKVMVNDISASIRCVRLVVNGHYRTIREVAAAIGVNMPPRKGFAFLDQDGTIALYCAQIDGNTKWENWLSDDETTFVEKYKENESSTLFQKRVSGSRYYNINTRRLLFVKENGYYRYVGVFRVSVLDFDARHVVMKKESDTQLKVKVTTRKTVTVITEETSIEIKTNI